MPHLVGLFRHADSHGLAVVIFTVKQAQLDAGSVLREQGEVNAGAIPIGSQRIRTAWPYFHEILPLVVGACPYFSLVALIEGRALQHKCGSAFKVPKFHVQGLERMKNVVGIF
jgi:hypothetical protein